jgi:hypothetical protein
LQWQEISRCGKIGPWFSCNFFVFPCKSSFQKLTP